MRRFTWERYDYDRDAKEHVKVADGEFESRAVQGAKSKATQRAGISGTSIWKLARSPHAFKDEGRVYKKQNPERREYANMNPILYLYVGKRVKEEHCAKKKVWKTQT